MFGGMGRNVRAPHEDLAGISDKLKKVDDPGKKETVGEAECSLYEAELTDEAAQGMITGGRGMGRMTEEAEFSGTAKIWLDGEGRITKFETTAVMVAVMQGNEVEISATRTVLIFGVGDTKVESPEGA
jgi:hypothetical protein